MKFSRYFTVGQSDAEEVFAKYHWQERYLALSGVNFTVPGHWSNEAASILAQKYARRAGVPNRIEPVEEATWLPEWLQRSVPAAEATFGAETDAREIFHRLAGAWTYHAAKLGYFGNRQDIVSRESLSFYLDTLHMLITQMAAPASPQWFNVGLWWAYGIAGGESGLWRMNRDLNAVEPEPTGYKAPQVYACFIQSISDDLVNDGGIMDSWRNEARVFKFGGGSGTNFSSLRGTGEPLSGGGRSSGVLSFLKIGDRAAGSIKSAGTTRRAAKMVVLDLDHPDIEEYIGWKEREEHKVASLVAGSIAINRTCEALQQAILQALADGIKTDQLTAYAPIKQLLKDAKRSGIPLHCTKRVLQLAEQGRSYLADEQFTTAWEGEAYQSVTGQNANNSVRITNAQMKACRDGGDIPLYWRTELAKAKEEGRAPKPCKAVSAHRLWQKIATATWSSADPGLQFDTTINEWHTCPKDGRIEASNPCSEYMWLNDTGCNLASLNLLRFLNGAYFDVKSFLHAVRIWTVILDVTVSMAGYPTRKIAEGCLKYRTLGLGYCGAGALMMRLGLPYASEASRGYVAAITALMHFQCGATSAEMASHFGTFPRFPANAADMHRVVANHVAATTNNQPFDGLSVEPRRLTSYPVPAYLMDAVTEVAKLCQESGLRHGYRNAQWTLCAPTGTIGILMDADTTGIEPDFSLVKFKMLAGGGYFKIVNQSIKPALTVMGYKEDEITEIVNYCLGVPDLATQPAFVAVLKAHGWDEQQLVDLNEKMPSLVDLRFAIKQDELLAMGLTHTEIAKLNRELCGTLTVEGAPHLREEHLAVFDCANRCGATGKRSLAAMDHLTMMAAAQPFFSGAISKTVNLPENATIDEVSRLMFSSWELMIKAVAFYRNESKLSQPLVSFMNDDQEEAMVGGSVVARVAHAAQQVIYRYISQRRRLPYRRQGYTQKFRLADHGVYLRTGEYPDGTLGEIWIDLAKQGAALRSWAGCFAIAVSLGLQHGVPLDEYIQAFVGVRFDPAGMVGNHPTIKTATSIIDMIFRELGINYLGMEDLRSVAPTEDTEVEVPEFYAERHANDMHDDEIQEWPKDEKAYSATKSRDATLARREAKLKGYEGESCAICGMFTMKRNGSCLQCDMCGSNTGCG